MLTLLRRRGVICALRGHTWQAAEIMAYGTDGRLYVRRSRCFCLRCPARG